MSNDAKTYEDYERGDRSRWRELAEPMPLKGLNRSKVVAVRADGRVRVIYSGPQQVAATFETAANLASPGDEAYRGFTVDDLEERGWLDKESVAKLRALMA